MEINIKKVIYFLFVVGIFLVPSNINAAEIYLEPDVKRIKIGQQIIVDILLNTENEVINAVEGAVIFPNDLLSLRAINDGDSILSLWLERPSVVEGCAGVCEVAFSGIIPGGFKGVLSPFYSGELPGKIISLVFEAKKTGVGILYIKDAVVLLHDGEGSATDTTLGTIGFEVLPSLVGSGVKLPLPFSNDKISPEEFKPEITKSPDVFNNQWFLVFNAQDKSSGIEYYEVKEGTRQFIKIESPYLLKNQLLYDEIVIRAVDKAGNVREVYLAPLKEKPLFAESIFWIIVIIIFFLGVYLRQRKWRGKVTR